MPEGIGYNGDNMSVHEQYRLNAPEKVGDPAMQGYMRALAEGKRGYVQEMHRIAIDKSLNVQQKRAMLQPLGKALNDLEIQRSALDRQYGYGAVKRGQAVQDEVRGLRSGIRQEMMNRAILQRGAYGRPQFGVPQDRQPDQHVLFDEPDVVPQPQGLGLPK